MANLKYELKIKNLLLTVLKGIYIFNAYYNTGNERFIFCMLKHLKNVKKI